MKLIWYYTLFSLTVFIPLAIHQSTTSLHDSVILQTGLNSLSVYTLHVAACVASIILLSELFLDVVSKNIPEYTEYRLLSLIGLVIYSIVLLFVRNANIEIVWIFFVLHNWQLLTEIVVVAQFLHVLCPDLYTNSFVAIVFITQYMSIVFMYAFTLSNDNNITLKVFYYLFFYGCQVIIFYHNIQWLNAQRMLYVKSKLSFMRWSETLTPEELCVLVLVVGFGALMISYDIVPYVTGTSYFDLR
jgi:hypothetical protein